MEAEIRDDNQEEWHGKPAEECEPEMWLDDGKLQAIEVFLEDLPGSSTPSKTILKTWTGAMTIIFIG